MPPNICLVLGRFMAWQPNRCKIVQSSLYSWITMYINEKKPNKVLPPYVKHPATRWHLSFHFIFLNSAILHSFIFGHSCLYLLKSPFNNWHQSIIFVGLTCFVSIYIHLSILQVFYPAFQYLNDKHVSWSACFSQMACFCHFVLFVCPAQSLLWVYFPYTICFPTIMGTWGHLCTPYVLGSLVASVHLSGISLSVHPLPLHS